jgi:hypothetical protein
VAIGSAAVNEPSAPVVSTAEPAAELSEAAASEAPASTFRLPLGEQGATPESVVEVAGTFNGWNRQTMHLNNGELTISLQCVRASFPAYALPAAAGVFVLSVPLAAGTYQYKFVVNGHWITSHAAPVAKDSAGNGQLDC